MYSYVNIEKIVLYFSIPLVYELDDDLKPIKHYYLSDPDEIATAAVVANQGKAR